MSNKRQGLSVFRHLQRDRHHRLKIPTIGVIIVRWRELN